MKKTLFRTLISLSFVFQTTVTLAASPYGTLQGYVKDAITGETLPGAAITYFENGILKGVYADESGRYQIKPLTPGNYEITFSFTGYQKIIKKGIMISAGIITFLDIQLCNDNKLPPVEISWFREPLIRKDYTGGVTRIMQKEISESVERDIKDLISQTAGVYQKEEGGSLNIRGSRANATQFYVDGIKMTGGFSLPKSAIMEITILSGGIPAMYGDATGGIVVITTKSASHH